MLKTQSIICLEVNGRNYEFSCAPESPLSDAIEANNQINAFLLGRAEQMKNAQKDQEEKKESEVEKPVEV